MATTWCWRLTTVACRSAICLPRAWMVVDISDRRSFVSTNAPLCSRTISFRMLECGQEGIDVSQVRQMDLIDERGTHLVISSRTSLVNASPMSAVALSKDGMRVFETRSLTALSIERKTVLELNASAIPCEISCWMTDRISFLTTAESWGRRDVRTSDLTASEMSLEWLPLSSCESSVKTFSWRRTSAISSLSLCSCSDDVNRRTMFSSACRTGTAQAGQRTFMRKR